MRQAPVLGFFGPFRFLSNFYVEPDGTSVEVEYQRAKCQTEKDRAAFAGLSPAQAKRLGRVVLLRTDWEDRKVSIMTALVEQKFRDHPALAWRLKQTEPAYLEETNGWGDRFWGVCGGTGQNHLGQILMAVRAKVLDKTLRPR